MSPPRFVFLDTSSLESKAFAFASQLFRAFAEACRKEKATLLLPAVTEREIRRHLEVQAAKAASDLNHALAAPSRTVPFLQGWEVWPQIKAIDERSARTQAGRALNAFLETIEVVRLDYETVDLSEVMSWFHWNQPPFDVAKKKHEFPDAFALSALLGFARKKHTQVAVVSGDADFERACVERPELLFFRSIAAFTERLISAEGPVSAFKKVLESLSDNLVDQLWEAFPELEFRHTDYEADVEDVEMEGVGELESNVIAIGEEEFTAEFTGTVDFVATVNYEAWYPQWPKGETYPERTTGRVTQRNEPVYGIVKIGVAPGSAPVTRRLDMGTQAIRVSELPKES